MRLHLDAADRVEPGHRLVEQDERRVVDEGLGDADALQHALRVLAQLHVAGVAQADVPQQVLDAPLPRRPGRARRGASRSAGTRARSGSRRSTGSPAGSRSRPGPPTPSSTVAARRPHEPERDLDRRGLAGAVRTEQTEDVARSTRRSTPLRISTRRARKPTLTTLRRSLMRRAGGLPGQSVRSPATRPESDAAEDGLRHMTERDFNDKAGRFLQIRDGYTGTYGSFNPLTGPNLAATTISDASVGFGLKIKITCKTGMKYITQTGQFVLDEQIRGTTSLATAYVREDNDLGTTGDIILDTIVGSFIAGETIVKHDDGAARAINLATNTNFALFPSYMVT